MKIKTTLVVLASVLLVFSVLGVALAGTEETVQASVSVPGFLSISASPIDFESVDPDGTYTDGSHDLNVTVDSNEAYIVTTETDNINFTSSGTSDEFEVKNMQFDPEDATSWTNYTTTAQTMFSGSVETGVGHNIPHRLRIPKGTDPETYSVGIIVKIS